MNKKRAFFRGFALVILLMLAAFSALAFRYMNGLSLQQVKAVLDGFGGMPPIVFIFICAARGVIFIPCGLLSALGGMLFGMLPGTIFAVLGFTVGSFITFCLARGFGKSWAQRMLGHKYDMYEGYISRDSFYSIFLMRVVPILPYDAVSCIAGMSRARADKYMLATLIGSLPGVFLYVFFGDSLRSLSIKKVFFSAIFMIVFAALPFCCRRLVKLIRKTA